jgi:hypothetical protein
MPHGCRCTRTFLGAPPTPRFGVSEARIQTPGADMRRGNEEVCVLEIVRPGMEDSESAEKQENTGIGPASACCGESVFTRVFHASCVPDATQRETKWSGASLIRDRHRLERSRVCSASLRYASCCAAPGTRAEHQPADVRNRGWANFHCFGLILTMKIATPTCPAAEAMCDPICHRRCATIRRHPICRHPSS